MIPPADEPLDPRLLEQLERDEQRHLERLQHEAIPKKTPLTGPTGPDTRPRHIVLGGNADEVRQWLREHAAEHPDAVALGFTTPAQLRGMRISPNAEVVRLPGFAHNPQRETMEQFLALCQRRVATARWYSRDP